ncbi:nucleotide pyrophosphohydrolase [Buchananella hordeovulneris]|uniref:Nucleotide pyrophosphohydrolase n=1 Tax=Buchananella hordeovulneris TaxID=52770 RepID=A0A1Q5PUF4_9ACTO|nr:nucleotide pyrophosphohydrolase [Buchananella hordeovulneris]MDO5080535.1 hypothetical protein [Buchananella hordeovulneris]OKL51208.1 nucleotide pyrophosphohydrolase [Buchananella hordeovulneris]RRD44396.1 nucleotide pyrophosphohydrolase [Buchananella hordeovulneris]RRD49108.1 nucleotide pyrophosphohydrolase [Buchananella hordeovulneris]
MAELGLARLYEIQREIHAKYDHLWGGLRPEVGKQQLLWMLAEAGEVADVMKKQGDAAITEAGPARAHFVEEMCDVLMYFTDVLLCYDVSPQEFTQAYLAKHARNLERW